ncbi:MAG: PAS domain S-box protein [Sulfurimonas sp.]|jgi:PAS domain S-box-containing protein
MIEKTFTTNKKLFLKIIAIMGLLGIIFAYFSSTYMRNMALSNLAEDDAKKTSELAFEVLYTKMQEGWAREDLYKIVARLNNLKEGLEIKTYRSTVVEELFGAVETEKNGLRDPLVQKGLKGETLFITTDDNNIRYIRPMIVKQECITCHYNAKAGDVNGVIDMTFPSNDIRIPLDKIITYFLIFTIIAIIVTFFIFQFLMTRIFINPISTFVTSIKAVKESQDYAKSVTCTPKTYEIYMLEKTFNELLAKVNSTLEKLRSKNKMLEEYKKAIDKSTIVSKADLNGVITYVNDQFCMISGYTQDELIGKNHNIVRSPNMSTEAFKEVWQTIQAKKTWRGLVENRAKSGKSYFVQATIMPILDENGEIVEYIGIRQDISELKNLQFKELNDSVNMALDIHFNDILKMIPASAVIVDRDAIIHFSNETFNSKFSYLDSSKKSLESFFIKKEGYVCGDSILDWKDMSSDFQENCSQKALVTIFDEEVEFYLFSKHLKEEKFYLILLIDVHILEV